MFNMSLKDIKVYRPVVLFMILVLVLVVVPAGVILNQYKIKSRAVEENLIMYTLGLDKEILAGVGRKAQMLNPLSSSTNNLARFLSSSLNESVFSESEVDPLLFQAFSTIPYVSEVSYISKDGLLLSYYNKGNQQPVAVYTNTTVLSLDQELLAAKNNFTCYTRPVNRDTGSRYGAETPSPLINPSALKVALDCTNGNASVNSSWIDDQDLLFLNTAVVDGRGAVALGFEAKSIVQTLSGSIGSDGSLFLATKDGQVLSEATLPDTKIFVESNNSVAFLHQNGEVFGNLICQANDGSLETKTLTISETKYDLYCSQVDILGVELVFVLAMPIEGPEGSLHKHFKAPYQSLIVVVCLYCIISVVFVMLIFGAAERVAVLSDALTKQKDATLQAERKGLEMRTNYANASHDVRASLAGITGLIDITLPQVEPGSELEANILLMQSCAKDLLGLLNSILDRSKLEAGKTTLEPEDFEVSKLLEDVADLFHTVGMKKGVEVVLDLSDGSVNKFDCVSGDRGKLRQVIANIVSNAVKFTSEGYVSIRAYARKPSFSNSGLISARNGRWSWLSCFLFREDDVNSDSEATQNDILKDPNCMEFVFEVDDTGVGIPKEMAAKVFENYSRIKETSAQEGTGLGLGIVQTLVRLMGGEIEIVEKEAGKKGTCFRFNTYLIMRETDQRASNVRDHYDDIESISGDYMSGDSYSRPSIHLTSPYLEASQVVLFIQNEERRRVCKKFMERQGLKVLVARRSEELSSTLKKVRQRRVASLNSSSKRSEKEVPLSSLDGIDPEVPPTHRRLSTRGSTVQSFVLIVIDTNGGPFHDLSRAIAEFRKNIPPGSNRVVWLDNPGSGNIQSQGLDEDKLPPTDIIITKPFHGSRLYQVLGLLPEFGGTMPEVTPANSTASEAARTSTSQPRWSTSQPRLSTSSANLPPSTSQPRQSTSFAALPPQNTEIIEVDKPFSGKRVLLVEDDALLRRIGSTILARIGASVEACNNGEEALQAVCRGFADQRPSEIPPSLPFDYILMDCEMPVMNGTEATRRIREEEARYGVHIPIFAVSAHTDGPELSQMREAGVDFSVSKPLNPSKLEEAVRTFEDNT